MLTLPRSKRKSTPSFETFQYQKMRGRSQFLSIFSLFIVILKSHVVTLGYYYEQDVRQP